MSPNQAAYSAQGIYMKPLAVSVLSCYMACGSTLQVTFLKCLHCLVWDFFWAMLLEKLGANAKN